MKKDKGLLYHLSKLELFDNAPSSLKRAVVTAMTKRKCGRGEKIITQGECGKGLFFLIAGSVDVGGTDPKTGDWQRFCSMQAPSFFGERSLTGGEKASADVIASSTDGELFVLPRRAFDVLAVDHPKWLKSIQRVGVSRVSNSPFTNKEEMLGEPGVMAKISGLSGKYAKHNGVLISPIKHTPGKFLFRLPSDFANDPAQEMILGAKNLELVLDVASVTEEQNAKIVKVPPVPLKPCPTNGNNRSNVKLGVESLSARLRRAMQLKISDSGGQLTVDDLFGKFDVDGKFEIDKHEFAKGCQRIGVEGLSTMDIDMLFAALDADSNGKIDQAEFRGFISPADLPKTNEIDAASAKSQRQAQRTFDTLAHSATARFRTAKIQQKSRYQRLLHDLAQQLRTSLKSLVGQSTNLHADVDIFHCVLQQKKTREANQLGRKTSRKASRKASRRASPSVLTIKELYRGLHDLGIVLSMKQMSFLWPLFFKQSSGYRDGADLPAIQVTNWNRMLSPEQHFQHSSDSKLTQTDLSALETPITFDPAKQSASPRFVSPRAAPLPAQLIARSLPTKTRQLASMAQSTEQADRQARRSLPTKTRRLRRDHHSEAEFRRIDEALGETKSRIREDFLHAGRNAINSALKDDAAMLEGEYLPPHTSITHRLCLKLKPSAFRRLRKAKGGAPLTIEQLRCLRGARRAAWGTASAPLVGETAHGAASRLAEVSRRAPLSPPSPVRD